MIIIDHPESGMHLLWIKFVLLAIFWAPAYGVASHAFVSSFRRKLEHLFWLRDANGFIRICQSKWSGRREFLFFLQSFLIRKKFSKICPHPRSVANGAGPTKNLPRLDPSRMGRDPPRQEMNIFGSVKNSSKICPRPDPSRRRQIALPQQEMKLVVGEAPPRSISFAFLF